MFGKKRLADILHDNGSRSPGEIRNEILAQLQDYRHEDDITMVIMKRI